MQVIEALDDLEGLEEGINIPSDMHICRFLTSDMISFLPRSWRYLRIVPYFIQGDTMQNDEGNEFRSIPRNGRMEACLNACHTRASLQNFWNEDFISLHIHRIDEENYAPDVLGSSNRR